VTNITKRGNGIDTLTCCETTRDFGRGTRPFCVLASALSSSNLGLEYEESTQYPTCSVEGGV
jgi:hypothetical protein